MDIPAATLGATYVSCMTSQQHMSVAVVSQNDACRERKNVNLPGVIVDLPTLTKKDEEDLTQWGLINDIDFIAASFVRKGSDVTNIRKVGCWLPMLHTCIHTCIHAFSTFSTALLLLRFCFSCAPLL